jgi:hypothetical protein
MSIIRSHTGFQPLREVWLGDSYPDYFYKHLKNSKLQDLCLQINEITKHDLQIIEKKIESFGVKVCRPNFESIDPFLDEKDNLCKPPITPRDWALTLGNTLYINPQYSSSIQPWQKDLDRYQDYSQNVRILDRFQETPEDWCWVTFPSVVRCGRDVFIDYWTGDKIAAASLKAVARQLSEKYRVHLGTTGDHSDGVFCPVKSGVIVATHYRQNYSVGWPGWRVINLPDTSARKTNGFNRSWWVPGVDLGHFNDGMIDNIQSWLGDSKETVFEVNMLVIDEKNVLILAYDDTVCRELERIGITPHVIDFRCRGFWDGGLHCLTLDIHREGDCLDYWPDRGPNGVGWDA